MIQGPRAGENKFFGYHSTYSSPNPDLCSAKTFAVGNRTRTVQIRGLWFIKTKRRRVFDAGGASLEGSALHGVVFDRSARPQKRAGDARLPGSGREIALDR